MKNKPSELFIGAIERGYAKARERRSVVTCADIWDEVVAECWQMPNGFRTMFAWDTSTAKNINRIGTIQECIERGYVPDLRLRHDGKRWVVERHAD